MVLGETSDICTDCRASPQYVRHLFACTTHLTDLSPEDLWRMPVGSSRAFSYLNNGNLNSLEDGPGRGKQQQQEPFYLGDTLDGDGGADLAAIARIRNGLMMFRELLPFLTCIAPPLEMKGRVYASCVRSSMTYGRETRLLLVDVGLKFERAEMQMIRLMCGIPMKDRTNEELRRMVGVEHIKTVIRSGRLR